MNLFSFGTHTSEGLITPDKAKELLANDRSAVLLDVRTPEEFSSGHIKGAKLLTLDRITVASAAKLIPEKTTPVVVYCQSGGRSSSAAKTLRRLGYTTVWDLGGISSWPYEIIQ